MKGGQIGKARNLLCGMVAGDILDIKCIYSTLNGALYLLVFLYIGNRRSVVVFYGKNNWKYLDGIFGLGRIIDNNIQIQIMAAVRPVTPGSKI